MKKHKLFPFLRWRMCNSLLAMSLATTLSLAGCTEDDNRTAGDSLPEGKYPLTFTATVEGQRITKAGTRATLNSEWEGNEEIAVKVGASVKKYTVDKDGTLTPEAPQYWISNPLTVRAWYSPTYSDQQPTSFTVAADQSSSESYQQSDMLYTSQTFTFSKAISPQLVFKHLPAKVVINLKAGGGLTADEVNKATVTLVNQALSSGKIDENGSVEQAATGGEEIIPNAVQSTPAGYQRTLQALLVPQQMQGKKFIKVVIGADVYYYTPTGADDAQLTAGKQHTYNITVNEAGLSVTVENNGIEWTESSLETSRTDAVFRITLSSEGTIPELSNLDGITEVTTNVYQTTNGNTFSFSYTVPDGEYKKGFLAQQGLTNVAWTASNNDNTYTYTFTYTNIRSDLQLEYADYHYPVQVGDYYYSDGNYLPFYVSGSLSACIGVVFKVGAASGDKASNYKDKLSNGTIHGYVVALKDAHSDVTYWGGDNVLIGTSTNQDDYSGYSNTQKILEKARETDHLKPDDKTVDYPAMYYISEYYKSAPTPANSSGWYFPSTGQLKDIYNASGSIQNKFSQAGGTWFNEGDYYSSCEYSDRNWTPFNVGYFSFKNGSKGWTEKDGAVGHPARYVRAILTF